LFRLITAKDDKHIRTGVLKTDRYAGESLFCEQWHLTANILNLQDENFEEFCGIRSAVNIVFKCKLLFKILKYPLHDPKQIFEFVQ
jgi:hypothetical protein